MSYPQYRCTQCTLMRCFYPGMTCDECLQHYANGDHLKHTEVDPLTGRAVTVDDLKKFKVSSFKGPFTNAGVNALAPGPVQVYPSPCPPAPPAPTSPDDVYDVWEFLN